MQTLGLIIGNANLIYIAFENIYDGVSLYFCILKFLILFLYQN